MAAAVTNPYKLTWGTYVVGDTQERLIVGNPRVSRTFETWELTLDVLIRGTSAATFAANCAEMESEFSKRRLLILWQVSGETKGTFNPASGTRTGLNTFSRIEKVGTPGADTDRSRLYTVTVGCELPATDTSGRRDNPYTIEYLPTRQRVVTFTGMWTAVTTNAAKAQYESAAPARFASILTSIDSGATFEKISERIEIDDQDQTLRFSVVYKEILDDQPGGSPNSTSIVDPFLTFARDVQQPGDSGGGGVKRLETFAVRFTCAIDKTVTQDAATLWEGTVKPYISSSFQTQFSPSSFAFVNVRYVLSPYTNMFEADLLIQAAIDPTDVIESVVTSRIKEQGGKAFTGVWNGNIFAKYVDQGLATRMRFGIRAVRVLGSVGPKQRVGTGEGSVFGAAFVNPGGGLAAGTLMPGGGVPAGGLGAALGQPGGAGLNGGGGAGGASWHLIDNDSSATVKTLGEPGGDQITVTDLVETTVEQYVEEP